MNQSSFTLHSNAKVNLCLRITGRLDNGYHTLSSLFQEIDLHDRLTFNPSNEFKLSCSNTDIPCDHRNLCSVAYRLMKTRAPDTGHWHIHIDKVIPVGAGLGGGSSNAATVMKFLNNAWQLKLSKNDMLDIAGQIGADVPFYIDGGTQLAEGTGNILTPVSLPQQFVLLLIFSPIHISTSWAYRQFNLTNRKSGYKFHDLFESGRIQWKLFENQFESVVFPAYPEIGNLKTRLYKTGALYAGLSGSGSTVFGIFANRRDAEHAQYLLNQTNSYLSLPIQ